MNKPILASNQYSDPFTERIELLYQELELAVMWQQPSILFAVYRSEAIRKDAEAALANKLISLKQKISSIHLEDIDDLSTLPQLFTNPESQNTIYFVKGMTWNCSQESVDIYKEINKYREIFPDNSIRVVFWFMEKEISDLATCAPEYWNFRHRAIDFTDLSGSPSEMPFQEEGAMGEDQKIITQEPTEQILLEDETDTDNGMKTDTAISNNANQLLTLGISHWRENNPQKALEAILIALDNTKVIQDDWFKAQCYHALALVKTSMGRFEEAIDAYLQAVAIAPDRIFPWNNLGQLYCKLDKLDDGIAAYEKAIEHNPQDPGSWHGLGNAYARLGLVQNAISAYQKAIKISPDFASAYNSQGDVYASQGSWNEAIESYQEATRLNPRLINPWINLGCVLQKKEQYEKAIHAYMNAIQLNPKIVKVWNELGNAYIKIKAYDEAVEAYEKVIELNPGFGWPYSNLAFAYYKKGNYSQAVSLYEKSISMLENDSAKAGTWNRLGDTYRQLGDYKMALQAYQTADQLSNGKDSKPKIIQVSPQATGTEKDPVLDQEEEGTMVEIGINDSGASAGNKEARACTCDQELGKTPANQCEENDACYWNGKGNAYFQEGLFDEAIAAYKRAIELSPDSIWPYLNNLTCAYYQKGKNRQNQPPESIQGSTGMGNTDLDNGVNQPLDELIPLMGARQQAALASA